MGKFRDAQFLGQFCRLRMPNHTPQHSVELLLLQPYECALCNICGLLTSGDCKASVWFVNFLPPLDYPGKRFVSVTYVEVDLLLGLLFCQPLPKPEYCLILICAKSYIRLPNNVKGFVGPIPSQKGVNNHAKFIFVRSSLSPSLCHLLALPACSTRSTKYVRTAGKILPNEAQEWQSFFVNINVKTPFSLSLLDDFDRVQIPPSAVRAAIQHTVAPSTPYTPTFSPSTRLPRQQRWPSNATAPEDRLAL